MRPDRWLWIAAACLLTACLSDPGVDCGDGKVCPPNTQCQPVGTVVVCATAEQRDACADLAENAICEGTEGLGACRSGVCLPIRCGDGILDEEELCDDGNTIGGDGCSARCDSNEQCGNHFVDGALGEECDDANLDDTDGCRNDCRVPRCGDAIVDLGEGCDEAAANSDLPDATCRTNCQPRRCSDGIRDAGEACDDGNLVSGDGCSGDCQSLETCGNGYIDLSRGESCDDGNQDNDDACRNDCAPASCGDGTVQLVNGEACDDGAANSNAPNAACRVNCQPRRCSDGVLDTGEVCDDGNLVSGDGCSGDCLSRETCGNGIVDLGEDCDDHNTNPNDGCRNNCTIATCGDGLIDPGNGELCDDGPANSEAADAACRTNCQPRRCGDGVRDTGEVCDDHNTTSGDGCAGECSSVEVCGNGLLDAATGEECDDHNASNLDACTNACRVARCGDGFVQPSINEGCDAGAANSNAPNAACRLDCLRRRCGDGIRDAGEVCDDGNVVSGDGCAGNCASLEVCGNHVIDVAAGEACDDGNSDDTDGCLSTCRIAGCGDGAVQPANGETCDDGLANSNAPNAACRTNCQPRRCGDGVTDAGEACDDGNLLSGDGCAGDCKSNETCGNGVIDAIDGEQCDDHNTSNTDGCTTTCKVARCGDGFLQTSVSEACDAGAANSNAPNAPCRTSCQLPRCGDGIVDPARGEVCDDGGNLSGDGCSGDCRSREVCGNSIVDVGEQCDVGIAGLSHDGCASTCSVELGGWTAGAQTVDVSRQFAGLALDTSRNQLVMFGGRGAGNQPLADTWTWNGAWRRYGGGGPSARFGHAMTYDAARKKAVLFGGSSSSETAFDLSDAWEWDGVAWSEVAQGVGLFELMFPRMAYDASRSVAVLVGAPTASGNVQTWTWNGTTWVDRTASAAAVSRRIEFSLAYDPSRAVIVLFGGKSGTTRLDELWEWDGTTWTNKTPATRPTEWPAGRTGHSMHWSPALGKLVLAGGQDDANGAVAGAKTWDGTGWADLTSAPDARRNHVAAALGAPIDQTIVVGGSDATGALKTTLLRTTAGASWTTEPQSSAPAPRHDYAFAYDPVRAVAVLVGGSDGTTLFDDTWEWNGTSWQNKTPTTRPSARFGAAIAYDPVRATMVLFGGREASASRNDTWEWNGTSWTARTGLVTRPSARFGARMVHHAASSRVVLFGGQVNPTSTLAEADTWEWSGTAWTVKSPATSPPARHSFGFAYDARRQRSILFGGTAGAGASAVWRNDTFEWNGQTWTATGFGEVPSPRSHLGFVYDPARDRCVLFGGDLGSTPPSQSSETWELAVQGATRVWVRVATAVAPLPRQGHGLIYDAVRARTLLVDGSTTLPLADQWTFAFDNAVAATESCRAATFDDDGDGLAGCADPDCWSVCDPTCPPGVTCAPVRSRCGDGTCNPALEHTAICPADCP